MTIEHCHRVAQTLHADLALWRVDLDAFAESVCLDDLAPEERARAARLSTQKAATRFLASRHALRSLVADALECPWASLDFGQNNFGKPVLVGSHMHFSLSRSGSMALIGISPNQDVGVDLEIDHAVQEMEAIAKRNFTGIEYTHWHAMAADQRNREFLVIWTLKEACVKALGTGLSVPLASVETYISANSSMASSRMASARKATVRLGDSSCELTVSSVPFPGNMVAAAAVASSLAVAMAGRLVDRA